MTAINVPELRPLSMGQLLDRAIRLYRHNFLKFIGIAAVAQLPAALLTMLFSLLAPSQEAFMNPAIGQPDDFFRLFLTAMGTGAVIVLVTIVFTQLAAAALTRAIADQYLGKSIGVVDAYRKVGRSWLTLLAAIFLIFLLVIALTIVFIIPCIGWLAAIPGFGAILFLTYVVMVLVVPVVILEKRPVSGAILRAWQLARRRFWWVLGFMFILLLFSQIIVTGPTFLIVFLVGGASGMPLEGTFATVVQQLTSFLLSILYYPLQLTCVTLLYFDVRVRTEGFDLALLAASEREEKGAEAVAITPVSPEEGFWPTWTEIGYFSLISVGGTVLIVGLFMLFFAILTLVGAAAGSGF